ncbi:diflavin oxidoreductase [Microbacterium sp. RD1]|uniref:diflavin oxidoreductase n=1 Tax=Microbacterium sp. RD1 TaxID=3457313 RepID=UPI003FA54384
MPGDVVVLFATESGNAESVARATEGAARALGLSVRASDMFDVSPSDVTDAATVLIVAATAGEGEPPERAIRFFDALMSEEAPRFDGVDFAVLALGDRAYANFCGHGEKLDARLAELGGRRLAELVRCDFEYEATASAWIAEVIPPLRDAGDTAAVRAVAIETPGTIVDAVVHEHRPLSAPHAERQSAHITVTFARSIPYEPGDLVDVTPENTTAVVSELLSAARLDDPQLAGSLRVGYDVTTLTSDALDWLAQRATDGELAQLRDDPAALSRYAATSRLSDAIRASGRPVSADELRTLVRTMAPRSYSIASSPLAHEGGADLLVAELRWEEKRAPSGVRRGVASDDLLSSRAAGSELTVRVRPNPHFRPPHPATDLIMIAAGSGVAPFRGFVQHRRLTGAPGRNWLLFGHRRRDADFLYEDDWRQFLADGSLTRLDTAFSRDQREKLYVQHLLEREAEELTSWIAAGAAVYICGDRRMGADVEATLDRILRPTGLGAAGLASQARLRKDTY